MKDSAIHPGRAAPRGPLLGKGLELSPAPGIMQARAVTEQGQLRVPAGAPGWVTEDLLLEAIEVWQPYYRRPLDAEDALEIALNVGRLADVLSREERP